MLEWLWLIPALPFAGYVVLALAGARLSRTIVASVGVGSVGLSTLFALVAGFSFITSAPSNHVYSQTLWTWISVSNFTPKIAFYLDPLSLVMTLVITFVSFLIHLYSSEFMIGDAGYSRFFAYIIYSSARCSRWFWQTTCCCSIWAGKAWGSAAIYS